MTLRCWTDGSYNNYRIGIGVVIYRGPVKIFQLSTSETLNTTNNVAEYKAFNACLLWLLRRGYTDKRIVIHSDSRMLVGQANGEMKLRSGSYMKEAEKAQRLLKKFTNLFVVWVPRGENLEADVLSKL
jgi:ribonuclease HI